MIPAVAITAKGREMLICHYFDSEEEMLRTKPFVKRWNRETFDKRHIRYHSSAAERYWNNRRPGDRIESLAIWYRNGVELKREYH